MSHQLLLGASQVCRRWCRVAQDGALWGRTRFTECDASQLERHFPRHDKKPAFSDHTGKWVPRRRIIDRQDMLCRTVDLDYVDRGEGVCYRLLRSISCLQWLHHPHIVPLHLVNLDEANNQ